MIATVEIRGQKSYGWIPPDVRTKAETMAHAQALAEMTVWTLTGDDWGIEKAFLWEISKRANDGKHLPTLYQQTGSCLPANAPVRMADGTEKPIVEIRVGEMVVTHTGKARRVVGIQRKRTDEQMRRIRVKGWADRLRCTDKHMLPVWTGEITWRPAQEILPGDFLLIGYGTTDNPVESIDVMDWMQGCDLSEISHYTQKNDVSPTHQRTSALVDAAKKRGLLGESLVTVKHGRLSNAIPRRIPVTAAFARWVGLYLAEGCASDHRVTFTLSTDEQTLAEEIVQLTRGVWNLPAKIQRSKSRPGSLQVRVSSLALVRFMKGFAPGSARSKRVPGLFFSANPTIQAALVGGWFDGDGYAKPHGRGMRITGVSASLGLARDMGQLSLSCSIPASTRYRKERGISKEAAELAMWPSMARNMPSTKLSTMPVVSTKEHATCSRMTPLGMAYRVVSNESLGVPEDEVFDIEVEHDHTFLAWGFVVHNCVGNGGWCAYMHLSAFEIVRLGQNEQLKILFMPYTYGRGRLAAGIRGRGDGSTGSGQADAVRKDGVIANELPGLPQGADEGGLTWGSKVEMDWSDGARIKDDWIQQGRKHLVKATAQVRSADDVKAAICNGYPVTIASNWGGQMSPQVQDGVLLNRRVTQWNHQMCVIGWWKHPGHGEIFYIQNSWGRDVHGTCPTGAPPGGFWVKAKDVQYIVDQDDSFAHSAFDGFPAQDIEWSLV